IASSAAGLGLTTHSLPSGAGHDAQQMAKITPTAMIFIPSRGGISHSPNEYTSPEDVGHGANTLLQTVLLVDKNGMTR
ncbi:MAG: M20/M25/M40 family metallo-hydrolase, partial [Gemmatimonadota bacterium]